MTIRDELWSECDVRVIDQRLGMGVGMLNTVVRVYHKSTGILVEVPNTECNGLRLKRLAMEMIEYALTKYPEWSKNHD